MVKWLIKSVLIRLKPIIRILAEISDLRVNHHCIAQGQNPLIFDDAKNRNIPKSVYFNTRSGVIRVGKNTIFGEDVKLLTGTHYNIYEAKKHGVPLHFVPEEGRDIIIGKGCFIGSSAIIIGKVTIGDYAVIGAGSVVTKDVPQRAFVAGIPAKILKMFPEEEIS